MNQIDLVFSAPPSSDRLLMELLSSLELLGEIDGSTSKFTVKLYGHPSQESWVFNLDEVIDALQDAKQTLEQYAHLRPKASIHPHAD